MVVLVKQLDGFYSGCSDSGNGLALARSASWRPLWSPRTLATNLGLRNRRVGRKAAGSNQARKSSHLNVLSQKNVADPLLVG